MNGSIYGIEIIFVRSETMFTLYNLPVRYALAIDTMRSFLFYSVSSRISNKGDPR